MAADEGTVDSGNKRNRVNNEPFRYSGVWPIVDARADDRAWSEIASFGFSRIFSAEFLFLLMFSVPPTIACLYQRSTRLDDQEDFRIAGPVPELAAWRTRCELGADVGFKARTPVSEQMRRSKRGRKVIGKHGVDILDDVAASLTEEALRSAEPCASEHNLVSFGRR